MKTTQNTDNARIAHDAYCAAVQAFLKNPSRENGAAVKFAKAETVARHKANA